MVKKKKIVIIFTIITVVLFSVIMHTESENSSEKRTKRGNFSFKSISTYDSLPPTNLTCYVSRDLNLMTLYLTNQQLGLKFNVLSEKFVKIEYCHNNIFIIITSSSPKSTSTINSKIMVYNVTNRSVNLIYQKKIAELSKTAKLNLDPNEIMITASGQNLSSLLLVICDTTGHCLRIDGNTNHVVYFEIPIFDESVLISIESRNFLEIICLLYIKRPNRVSVITYDQAKNRFDKTITSMPVSGEYLDLYANLKPIGNIKISPSGRQLAILYQAVELTPAMSIIIYDFIDKKLLKIANNRFDQNRFSNMSWLSNQKILLQTPYLLAVNGTLLNYEVCELNIKQFDYCKIWKNIAAWQF